MTSYVVIHAMHVRRVTIIQERQWLNGYEYVGGPGVLSYIVCKAQHMLKSMYTVKMGKSACVV